MAKFILAALLAACLTACGGGAGSNPFTPPASACTPTVVSVLLKGDSTQWGYDSTTKARAIHNPGIELQANMDAQFGLGAVVVTDVGVSGTIASQATAGTADVVVANFGINDSAQGVSLEAYKAAMLATGATLIETESPISAPVHFGDQAPYAQAAKELGLPVADVYSYVLAIPSWGAMEVDGVHPDDALYVDIVDHVLAPAVAKQVAPLRCVKV